MSELAIDPEAPEAEDEDEVVEVPSPGGDVDVASVPKRHHKGEQGPVVLAGFWVRLSASDEVPEEYQGHIAVIDNSPWKPVPYANDGLETIHGYRFDKGTLYTVTTRDSSGATLVVSQDAFSEVSSTRAGLLQHA